MSETSRPIRLQLSVTPGFSFQAVGHAANGLPTVKVARPSKWGNWIARKQALTTGVTAVEAFEDWLANEASDEWKEKARESLRGRNLACWDALDARCHADVLLRFVNQTCEALDQPTQQAPAAKH